MDVNGFTTSQISEHTDSRLVDVLNEPYTSYLWEMIIV